MGMPDISLQPVDRNDAFNTILATIALQEAAMAHILNADGEKLQVAIKLADPDIVGPTGTPVTLTEINDVNDSIRSIIGNAMIGEVALRCKLNDVLAFIQFDETLSVMCPFEMHVQSSVDTAPIEGAVVSVNGMYQLPDTDPPQFYRINRIGTSNSNGDITFQLPAGPDICYTVRQVEAPDGYTPDPNTYPLTMYIDEGITGPTLPCTLPCGDIEFDGALLTGPAVIENSPTV